MPGPAVPPDRRVRGSPGLINFANTLLQPLSIFIVSEIFVLGFGVAVRRRSTRSILKIFRYTLPLEPHRLLAFASAC